jgi:hypothetical protein
MSGAFPIGDDRGIDPLPAVHATPRCRGGLLHDLQLEGIRKTRHHKTPAPGAGLTLDHGGSGGRSTRCHHGVAPFLVLSRHIAGPGYPNATHKL